MSIFVIDDHPLMREAVAMLLRRLRTKANIVELDRLGVVQQAVTEHGVPELICLDLRLPDTHGVSGVREMRRLFPDTSILNFMYLTNLKKVLAARPQNAFLLFTVS